MGRRAARRTEAVLHHADQGVRPAAAVCGDAADGGRGGGRGRARAETQRGRGAVRGRARGRHQRGERVHAHVCHRLFEGKLKRWTNFLSARRTKYVPSYNSTSQPFD